MKAIAETEISIAHSVACAVGTAGGIPCRREKNKHLPMNALAQLSLPIGDRLFHSDLIAGFECELVHGGRHDLLCTTRHLPEDRMQALLRIAREHGLLTIWDGLVPGHKAVERLRAAHHAGVRAIWDLPHYHRNGDPARCARIVAKAAHSIASRTALALSGG